MQVTKLILTGRSKQFPLHREPPHLMTHHPKEMMMLLFHRLYLNEHQLPIMMYMCVCCYNMCIVHLRHHAEKSNNIYFSYIVKKGLCIPYSCCYRSFGVLITVKVCYRLSALNSHCYLCMVTAAQQLWLHDNNWGA